MVVDAEVKERLNKTPRWSERRSTLEKDLTEPTLLEMSGKPCRLAGTRASPKKRGIFQCKSWQSRGNQDHLTLRAIRKCSFAGRVVYRALGQSSEAVRMSGTTRAETGELRRGLPQLGPPKNTFFLCFKAPPHLGVQWIEFV